MVEIVIVEKGGELKQTNIKDFKYDDLYKKCKFRKSDGFDKRTVWEKKINGKKVIVELWARNSGKVNTENKYDFPPPVDNALYFGSCALVGKDKDGNTVDLSLPTWKKLYEKLFGGFENLNDKIEEDNDEEDELDDVPADMKTKYGYLKDGFVVDDEEVSLEDDADEDDDDDDEPSEEFIDSDEEDEEDDEDYDDDDDEDLSELSEDSYEYSD